MRTSEAIELAQKKGLDLVEIAPKAKPPVAKIINSAKFKYEQNKKSQALKKKTKTIEIKSVQLSPTIGKHDLEVRLKRGGRFLKQGHKVKLVVRFFGRHLAHKNRGLVLIKEASESLAETGKLEAEPKWRGRMLEAVLAPKN